MNTDTDNNNSNETSTDIMDLFTNNYHRFDIDAKKSMKTMKITNMNKSNKLETHQENSQFELISDNIDHMDIEYNKYNKNEETVNISIVTSSSKYLLTFTLRSRRMMIKGNLTEKQSSPSSSTSSLVSFSSLFSDLSQRLEKSPHSWNIHLSSPIPKTKHYLSTLAKSRHNISISKSKNIIYLSHQPNSNLFAISCNLPFLSWMKSTLKKRKQSYIIISDLQEAIKTYNEDGSLYPNIIICNYSEVDLYDEAFMPTWNIIYSISDGTPIYEGDKVHVATFVDLSKVEKCKNDKNDKNKSNNSSNKSSNKSNSSPGISLIFGSPLENASIYRGKNEESALTLWYNYNFESITIRCQTSIEGPLFSMYMMKFNMDHAQKVLPAFNNLAKSIGKTFTSDDIKDINHGSFNVVYDISSIYKQPAIIRILISDFIGFDSDAITALMNDTDSGFIVPLEMNDECEYVILPLAKSIKKYDYSKVTETLRKNIAWFKRHPDFVYIDYNDGNIMEINGDYVIVDVDLNMVSDEMIKNDSKYARNMDEYIGEDVKGTFNIPFASALLTSCDVEINKRNLSIAHAIMAEVSEYSTWIKLSEEMLKKMQDRINEECKD